MNYYERYCGDYQRDTAHLSLAEHGAYTMLLDTYFSVEKPLPKELPSLYRVCRAMTRLEQHAVKAVADQFFPVSEMDGLRHNHRADREIAKARPKIEAARINGRKGGRPPKESFQQTRREAQDIPDGLSTASGDIAAAIPAGEPGGKAHQHQHQYQPHQDRDCSSIRTIYSPEEQVCVSGIASGVTSTIISNIYSSPTQPFEARSRNSVPPGAAGACCKALARHGVQGSNPHHPTLLALLQAGAVEDEFVQAAKNAVAKGKENFAYVIGTVKRQREEAARLVLHQGRMPNRQELLESSNRTATKGWLPPELRLAEAGEPQSKEVQHAS
ncbi:YdaU family protein [Nitrosospira briensis]|uniref:YdaU family protein n=1 Tax=Nitrosospira briensis TaxID=35799 RepID=UPI0018D0F15B|nr:YdaU family protein [Nitrosospira briensis]